MEDFILAFLAGACDRWLCLAAPDPFAEKHNPPKMLYACRNYLNFYRTNFGWGSSLNSTRESKIPVLAKSEYELAQEQAERDLDFALAARAALKQAARDLDEEAIANGTKNRG